MNSSTCRNQKLKIAAITRNGQKRLYFIVVIQLRTVDGSGFNKQNLKIIIVINNNNNNKDSSNNNNDNVTKALNNYKDNDIC